jgi:hypothetical protein
MSKKKFEGELCIYCGERESTRDGDHVPPQCFFKEKSDNELIKVPCCEKCNNGHSKIDERMRNIFTAEERAANHPSMIELAEKRDRSWDRNDPLFKRQISTLRLEERIFPDGTKTLWPTMDLEVTDFISFLRRITLALLFKESKLRSAGSKVSCIQAETLDTTTKKEFDNLIFRNSIRVIGRKEFQYCGVVVENSHVSLWWMKFFEGPEFYTSIDL